MGKLLDKINSPQDLKNMSYDELNLLSAEIRDILIKTVSDNGGHLSSNLGVVELTIAMHKSFRSPTDKFVWDVGHQAYTHKLLTGRKDSFKTIRKENGISGFTRPEESEHDIFASGHSSTAVSSSFGLAMANKIKGDKGYIVAVVGDGSFTGGMAYEGLNNAGRTKSKLIVVLNDNEMSISKNVGSFAKYLAVIRSKPEYAKMKSRTETVISKIPLVGESIAKGIYKIKTSIKNSMYGSTMFEDMGFRYMGPVDGHNIEQLCDAFQSAKMVDSPVLLHVKTTKGKGYDFAEQSPSTFHGISKFDINSGEPISGEPNFSSAFGEYLCCVAEKDKRICAVTAAMLLGTGLKQFSEKFSDRFFDVGIAEEHAVTFSSGLAGNGMLPIFAVYSTFLQRCYDQIIHDGSLQNQKIVLAVDRAGFVGEDGESHQGLFDVAFLSTIPNVTIYSPSTFAEMRSCFNKALYHSEGVVAVRYPRGGESKSIEGVAISENNFDFYGDSNSKTVIVTYGRVFSYAYEAMQQLKDKSVSILKINRVFPLDKDMINVLQSAENIIFFEEGIKNGGIAEKLGIMLLENKVFSNYKIVAVEDDFVKQASVCRQLEKYHLDSNGIKQEVLNLIG